MQCSVLHVIRVTIFIRSTFNFVHSPGKRVLFEKHPDSVPNVFPNRENMQTNAAVERAERSLKRASAGGMMN